MATTATTYPVRVPHYEDAAGVERLRQLAQARGLSVTGLLRLLAREEEQRERVVGGR